MHGLGNDYVFLDAVAEPVLLDVGDLPGLARRVSDRRFGVGSDGLIMIAPPTEAARAAGAGLRMRIWNTDGSEAEMCGNGLRCAVKMAAERGEVILRGDSVLVETGSGLLRARVGWGPGLEHSRVDSVSVDLPAPRFNAGAVEGAESLLPAAGRAVSGPFGEIVPRRVGEWEAVLVSVGNPHMVVFLEEPIEGVDLARIGPAMERHAAFPKRINVQVVNVTARDRARMRSWERGAGLTMACGTGACAVLAAGHATGRLGPHAALELPGGSLFVEWDESERALRKTGPAAYVSEGDWLGDAVITDPPFPVLETERLILRRQEWSDVPAIRAMMNHPEVGPKLLTPPVPYPEGEAEKFIARTRRGFREGTAIAWAIQPREGPSFAGNIGLRIEKQHSRAEIGYTLDPAHWGKGYASEASRLVLDHAFGAMGLQRVFASHFLWNPASGRVLEKAGLTLEGVLRQHVNRRGTFEDCRWFGVTKEDWMRGQEGVS